MEACTHYVWLQTQCIGKDKRLRMKLRTNQHAEQHLNPTHTQPSGSSQLEIPGNSSELKLSLFQGCREALPLILDTFRYWSFPDWARNCSLLFTMFFRKNIWATGEPGPVSVCEQSKAYVFSCAVGKCPDEEQGRDGHYCTFQQSWSAVVQRIVPTLL